jgi:protein TonB
MQAKSKSMSTKNLMLPSAAMALLLSLSLFGVMYSVIKGSHGGLEKKEALPTIDFVRLKRDSEVESISRHKPPPPPPAPPPPSKMKVVADAVSSPGMSGLEIPNLNLKADVGGDAMIGTKGAGAAMFDGELIPLNCPDPRMPADAARAGLSGYVVILVDVGADGSFRNAKIIESQPKGLFDATVVMALQRCKFKPTIKDGMPVAGQGKRRYNFGKAAG